MQTSATAAKFRVDDKPKTKLFSLKTPYMKQGRVTQLVAETPNMWIHTKVNAEGGENEIHKHVDEDHAFIVLEGQMSVFDENGGEIQVKQYQA
jgi:quercetin dioxygenase-like cupin family protein